MAASCKGLAIALLCVGMLMGVPAPAAACSCVSSPPCESLWRSDTGPIVFEATVVSIDRQVVDRGTANGERIISNGLKTVHLEDVRNLLGEGSTTIVTSGDGASCGYDFAVGQRYVIDAYSNAGTLSTGLCSKTTPIERAGPLLAYIESLARPSPGATVSGTVQLSTLGYAFTPRSRPEGRAGVAITIDGPVSRTTASSPDGTFSFDRLPPGHYRLGIDAGSSGLYSAAPGREFHLPNAHACYSAYVSMTLNATIEGSVVDDAGKPVAGASVALRPTDALSKPLPADFPTFVGYANTRSDERGRYLFESVPPGQYVVGLNVDSGPTHGSLYQPRFVTAPDGQPEVIEFPLGGHTLLPPLLAVPTTEVEVSGRVVWPDGRPGVGMRVRASARGETTRRIGASRDAATDADGRFSMLLPAGIRHGVRAFVDPDRVRSDADYDIGAEAEIIVGSGDVVLVLGRRQ